ncbi:50S ribosome-binding GTPase [Candidatus Micrarchaeota archaeon]|nr:50S ribosome-binding GTPase [Candidatus Micrarchaeota archaeon]
MPFRKFLRWLTSFFNHRKEFSLGLYGATNVGKSTLANRISMDWTGTPVSTVSEIPHETREVKKKERIELHVDGKKLTMNLLDMPGIATKVDYHDFIKFGLKQGEAQQRAKEATKGIIEAIKWLDHVDVALVVMDACEDPFTQVNLTILGNLEARKIPVLLVANKIDKKNAKPERIKTAFPQHSVLEISALKGDNINHLYSAIAKVSK